MGALIDSSLPSDDQDADEGADWRNTTFSVLKTDPGRVSFKSVLRKLEKLRQIEALELPDTLCAEIRPKLLRQYRVRAAAKPPREVRRHPEPIRYTLLAAFCWQRRQEIIDGLVDLLIQMVHRISAQLTLVVFELVRFGLGVECADPGLVARAIARKLLEIRAGLHARVFDPDAEAGRDILVRIARLVREGLRRGAGLGGLRISRRARRRRG
jgi:hypothetical protein